MLSARPCTPAQLANACIAGGFGEVFPATWGDELIAAGCLEKLERRTGSVIFCACPRVAEQLRGAAELRPFIVQLISPPVAVARYLRALFPGTSLAITYVGECPGAEDDAIDQRLSPRELIARLEERGITLAAQSTDLLAQAHDRRRFHSIPGGAPSAQRLGEQSTKHTLVDVHAGAALASLAVHTMPRGNALVDLAPQFGCACAGAVSGSSAHEARAAVVALEPPRAQSEIVDAAVRVRVSLPPAGDRDRTDVTWDDFLAALPATMSMHGEGATGPIARPATRAAPRRVREKKGTLPRAYLAARRGALEVAHHGAHRARGASQRSDETQERSPRRRSPGAAPPKPASFGLAPGDRWLLAGLMLAGSLLVAVLTSALTVRGIAHTRASSGATSGATSVASSAAARADSFITVAAAPIPASGDTMPIALPPRAADSLPVAPASHIDSAPRHEEVHAAAPPPRRASPRTERRALTVAEHVRAAPQPRPVTAPPSLAPSTVAPQTVAVSATPPPATQAIIAAASGAPAAASAANNALVLEELRAIHAEIDARKRHVDSLTASLDSLKRGTKPD
ncbi:MAG TPA: hypothetical protein VIM15_05855 [Gemmatimonadaceae bacterium]